MASLAQGLPMMLFFAFLRVSKCTISIVISEGLLGDSLAYMLEVLDSEDTRCCFRQSPFTLR
jgi:hypothetical protein